MHFSAAQSLQALRIRQLELRDKFQHLVRGYKHSLSADGLDTFWRSWSLSVESINAKSQEVRPALAETCHRALGGLRPDTAGAPLIVAGVVWQPWSEAPRYFPTNPLM